MCRLLLVKSEQPFHCASYLKDFAQIAKNSKEFQGDGWGCAFRRNNRWQIYKNITPIWQNNLEQFGTTTLLLAHARSAFGNEGIKVENNMPYYDERYVFIFNGELHGVKINETGRIGAEKIFNYIKRFDHGDMLQALHKGIEIINKRTAYVKALNLIIAEPERIYLHSAFNENDDYFTMHWRQLQDLLIICSEPFPGELGWQKIASHTTRVFS